MNEQRKRGLLMALEDWNAHVDEEHRFSLVGNYEGTCIAHPKSFNKGNLKEKFSKFPEIFDKVFVITGKEDQFINTIYNTICKELFKLSMNELLEFKLNIETELSKLNSELPSVKKLI